MKSRVASGECCSSEAALTTRNSSLDALMRTGSQILSVLLHPLWMPTLTIVLCFAIDPYMSYGFTKEGLLMVYGMVFAMTALFPLTSILLMRRTGLVHDMTMPTRQERIPAYLSTLVYYGMCYYLLRTRLDDPVTLGIFFGATLVLLLVLLITLRWKISAHMAGIGGLIGALLAVMVMDDREAPLLMCGLFLLAGALGTARLVASDHTPAQVYAGAILGCTSVYMCAANGLMI